MTETRVTTHLLTLVFFRRLAAPSFANVAPDAKQRLKIRHLA